MVTLDSRAAGRDNNLNLIRMLAAVAVLVSHAYPIARGPHATEPLRRSVGLPLGLLAVIAFFAISGFLISRSFDRRQSNVDFWRARLLRIYPALVVVLLLTVLLLGAAFTTLPRAAYWANFQTWSYIPRNLSLRWLQFGLPGVFEHNPYPRAINGSLWTLFWEVACYGMAASIGWLGALRRGTSFGAFLTVAIGAYVALRHREFLHNSTFEDVAMLSLAFVCGMAAYVARRVVPISAGLCALVAAAIWLTHASAWGHEIIVAGGSYLVLCLGYLRWPPLLRYNRLGDYSYGIYIYAFPCEQMTAALAPGLSPPALAAISLAPTLACAALSWHLVEARALRFRPTLTALAPSRIARAPHSTLSR